jgi:aryl carrier-like protein
VSDPASVDVDLSDPAVRLEIVRTLWREVLDLSDVADDTTFFDAGGDSLRLVVLVERLNEATGRALRTVDLFRAGTVRGHAELLAQSAATAPTRPAARASGVSRDRLLDAARVRATVAPRQAR